jgi:hypothetical protein
LAFSRLTPGEEPKFGPKLLGRLERPG